LSFFGIKIAKKSTILKESEASMKATGIVRRIDELGRIVIPKEIRKSLRIKEGENLEIFVDSSENIILKKHSLLKKMEDFAQDLTDSVQQFLKDNIIITDNDHIIAASGNLKKEILNKEISEEIENKIKRREEMLEKHQKTFSITDELEVNGTYAISPIIINGDCSGTIIILSTEDSVDDSTFKVAQIISEFIKKNIET